MPGKNGVESTNDRGQVAAARAALAAWTQAAGLAGPPIAASFPVFCVAVSAAVAAAVVVAVAAAVAAAAVSAAVAAAGAAVAGAAVAAAVAVVVWAAVLGPAWRVLRKRIARDWGVQPAGLDPHHPPPLRRRLTQLARAGQGQKRRSLGPHLPAALAPCAAGTHSADGSVPHTAPAIADKTAAPFMFVCVFF